MKWVDFEKKNKKIKIKMTTLEVHSGGLTKSFEFS
jgi:hypothetical protein